MIRYTLFILIAFIFIGCGKRASFEVQSPLPPPPPEDTVNLTPLSPSITYASGWSMMTITANYAKTVVDVGAHFNTSRNACGKDAYGAIGLEAWNKISLNTNTAIKDGLTLTDYCVPLPEDNIYLARIGINVEVKLERRTETLYEIKDGQICSSIRNHQVSDELLNALTQVIIDADKEDCPNGWGS